MFCLKYHIHLTSFLLIQQNQEKELLIMNEGVLWGRQQCQQVVKHNLAALRNFRPFLGMKDLLGEPFDNPSADLVDPLISHK